MEGKVPTPAGNIEMYVNDNNIKIKSPVGEGTLLIKSKKIPKTNFGTFINKGNNQYELTLEKDRQYNISYHKL